MKTLDQMYNIYVTPPLDYCNIIYNIPFIANEFYSLITLPYSMERLEKVQYQAALAVTGCWKAPTASGTSKGILCTQTMG